MSYVPPYKITPKITTLIEQIGEVLGTLSVSVDSDDLRLRRIHRIQTIHGSLAIEGNTLTEEQISTILDGKPAIAESTRAAESTPFVEFMLQTILERIISSGREIEQVDEQVDEQVNTLILALKDGELGTRALMAVLRLKHRPTFVYDYLQPSLSSGLVEMTQPDSPKSPTQKYRLTLKGRKFLN